jgi:lysophospholipase L1-like esterase
MRSRILAAIAAFAGLMLTGTSALAGPAEFQAPRQYYLALGDSLAFGYQPDADFAHGYVQDFAMMLNAIKPVTLVNFGCPGERTDTYLGQDGICPDAGLIGQTQSQETEALGFLARHPGQVSPITLDLGGNDVVGALSSLAACSASASPPTCIRDGVDGLIEGNLETILRDLRSAAPRSEIIVLTYYNPFAAQPVAALSPGLSQLSNAVVAALNEAIDAAAAEYAARVADAYQPFNLAGPLCGGSNAPALAWSCSFPAVHSSSGLPDIHPTTAGYMLIADQFKAASTYARMGD